MEGVYLEPSVYIMQLKNQLAPKEAKNMLQGVRSIAEAWGILDSHYGDRLAAITTITATLRNHKTTGQAAHEKLEGLVQAVRQATVSLKHVQAEKTLSHDFSLISSLIEKLPAAYVDRWDEFVGSTGEEVSWNLFLTWLEKARTTAKAARGRDLCTRLNNSGGQKGGGGKGLGASTVSIEKAHMNMKQEVEKIEGDVNAITAAKDPKIAKELLKRSEEKAKPCPLCKELGNSVVHCYERNFPKWPADVSPRSLMCLPSELPPAPPS